MPAISVLIPCYNVATTVDEAISSLVQQTFPDFEVVLVDDGSTDGTLNRLQDWTRHDQRIKILPRPHAGIIAALNAGLEACGSDIIARMDADDRSTPNRLKRQVELLGAHPQLTLVSSLVKGFPEGGLGAEFQAYIKWLNTLLTDEDIKGGMFLQSPLAHPSVAYRRSWVERVGAYQDHGWAEDYDLWLRLYLAGARFGKIQEILLEWRDHPHRLTHTDGRYSKQSDLRLKAFYLTHGPLANCKEIVIWGTSPDAHQLGQQLINLGCPLSAYVGSEPVLHPGQVAPLISPVELFDKINPGQPPILLVAENDPVRRAYISQQLASKHLRQGINWWLVG